MTGATRPRVAHFGEHGAYTEEAALNVFGDAETVPCANFGAVFGAVASGQADFGVIAVENSLGGWLNETYDLLMAHRDTLTIRAEYDYPGPSLPALPTRRRPRYHHHRHVPPPGHRQTAPSGSRAATRPSSAAIP
ncbi:MAG: prephenate dehydratase domain-containing protein [Thermomicrobiales bacterium]